MGWLRLENPSAPSEWQYVAIVESSPILSCHRLLVQSKDVTAVVTRGRTNKMTDQLPTVNKVSEPASYPLPARFPHVTRPCPARRRSISLTDESICADWHRPSNSET